jgi:hypothetical protein
MQLRTAFSSLGVETVSARSMLGFLVPPRQVKKQETNLNSSLSRNLSYKYTSAAPRTGTRLAYAVVLKPDLANSFIPELNGPQKKKPSRSTLQRNG